MKQAGEPDIRTLASSVIYEDSWMSLRRDEIERRDGTRGTYAVVEKPDFAVVIPADSGRFCLVEEYRYPVRRRAWAFPQGAFPGRAAGDPEDLARLELAQETGLRARELTRWVSRDEFKDMIRDGMITDDSTVAAYSLLVLHEENGSAGDRPPVPQ
jgi:8-oxo-dGTP pyrophosphatase MutT (NUDIX family)